LTPRSRTKRRNVQDRHEDDPPGHVGDVDLALQMVQHDRALVFVPVIATEGDETLARFRLRADHHGHRDEVVAPDGIVLQRHEVVAAARGVEIEFLRADDPAFHGGLLN
jgi:hypothetical protein